MELEQCKLHHRTVIDSFTQLLARLENHATLNISKNTYQLLDCLMATATLWVAASGVGDMGGMTMVFPNLRALYKHNKTIMNGGVSTGDLHKYPVQLLRETYNLDEDEALKMEDSHMMVALHITDFAEFPHIQSTFHYIIKVGSNAPYESEPVRKLTGCGYCGKDDSLQKTNLRHCSACGNVAYCCKEHQREHWAVHKLLCKFY